MPPNPNYLFQSASTALSRANGGEALALAAATMRQAADLGHPGAANNFGTLAQFGRGVAEDLPLARRYYAQAAEAGLAAGQFNLGFMWLNGLGGAADAARAYALFLLAAEQDDTDALTHLGRMLVLGDGCVADVPAGLLMWERGARLGDGRCAFNLGNAYAGGHAGGAEDLVAGLRWFLTAERLSADGAQAAVAKILPVLTPVEIELARGEAALWLAS